MKRLNVCVVTGTRAEFGIWRPVLRAMLRSKKLRTQLVVTGMHLQPGFGNTVQDIEREGFDIAARVEMHDTDGPAASLARGITGMATAFRTLKSDLVMVLGDRLEILAAASAALAEQIPIAHLHGGETAPGQWDEQIRHAVTKMAHLHFCATPIARKRILQMGENPAAVHLVGAPALDALHALAPDLKPAQERTGPIVVLLHPSSPDEALEEKRTAMLLAAVNAIPTNRPLAILGPNNDPGHRGILRAYTTRGLPITMSVSQQTFWTMLASAPALVGNSSAGILEAASLATPVINIGARQAGRERNANVLDADWSPLEIRRLLADALDNKNFLRRIALRKNLYGHGNASERIVQILEHLPATLPTTKQFFDA